jgi:hypothetical protein
MRALVAEDHGLPARSVAADPRRHGMTVDVNRLPATLCDPQCIESAPDPGYRIGGR